MSRVPTSEITTPIAPHLTGRCSERHADADLRNSLRDGVRQNTVDPEPGQEEGTEAEGDEDLQGKPAG